MGCNNGCGFGGGGCLWIILIIILLCCCCGGGSWGGLRLWWLWLQQRLREQLLLRRQYNSRTGKQADVPWGVFPHGTFLCIKQVERKRNTCIDVQQPSISVPRAGRAPMSELWRQLCHTWAEKWT